MFYMIIFCMKFFQRDPFYRYSILIFCVITSHRRESFKNIVLGDHLLQVSQQQAMDPVNMLLTNLLNHNNCILKLPL